MNAPLKQTVEDWLNQVDYSNYDGYVPSEFALEFVNFIKQVNGADGEENLTPVLHYKMLDVVAGKKRNIANMLFRGSGKTTVFAEYFFLYLGVYGKIPGFGKVPLALYVSDSVENGVKNMRKNIQHRWENSDFLQEYIPNIRLTDVRWEFINLDGVRTVVKGYGAQTGVRGTKEMGKRPVLAVLDDLVSDEDARSDTVIAAIEDTVYKAVNYALHPTRSKIIWNGTPFNSKDPLYKAIESGAWHVNVFPICEEFPCKKENFRGAWPDRFPYEYVKAQHDDAVRIGKIDTFNQELMLRIMSDDERLIQDSEILWYKRSTLLKNKQRFNFYITTDFATTEKTSGDYSVIAVWAINHKGDWFLVDCVVKKQLMNKNIDELFRLAQLYNPLQVGIEVSGQQSGFIPWIMGEMLERNIYFTLASQGNNNNPGIRPVTDKMQRFQVVVPWFKSLKMYFPEELKNTPEIQEYLTELRLASPAKFKSKHDDCIDSISQLQNLQYFKPSGEIPMERNSTDSGDIWEIDDEDEDMDRIQSYIV